MRKKQYFVVEPKTTYAYWDAYNVVVASYSPNNQHEYVLLETVHA
jgi:hypothetical protein